MMSPPERVPRRLVRLSVAAIAVNVAIVVTGGVVRVTGSGLGCPDWPTCAGGEVLPRPGAEAGWHQAVEFGNRLMSFVVLAVVVWLWLQLRRHRSDDSARRWAGWLVVGVIGQGVLGGITVRLELHPLIVASHFLASMVLIAVAVVVHHRLRSDAPGPVSPPVRRLGTVVAALGAVVLVLGTIVTAAGPHAGDPGTPRLGVDIRTVARLHAAAVWCTVGATVVGLLLARREPAAPRVRTAFAVLFAVEVVQGAIGYLQYAIGIPAWLVALHLLGASLFWVAAVRAALVTRDRRPEIPLGDGTHRETRPMAERPSTPPEPARSVSAASPESDSSTPDGSPGRRQAGGPDDDVGRGADSTRAGSRQDRPRQAASRRRGPGASG